MGRIAVTPFALLVVFGAAPVYAQSTAGDDTTALVSTASQSVASLRTNAPTDEEEPSASVSVGSTNRGWLRNGVRLEESEVLHFKHRSADKGFGIAELVTAVERAATYVARVLPGTRLTVGDLSRERGGRARPHRSHRNGRDADLGFYLLDPRGNPVQLNRFVNITHDGCGMVDNSRYCFDEDRNWELIAALANDPRANVQYVLVARHIRRRLLATGERRGASPALLERVALITEMRSGSSVHRNHFHVRVYCPINDRPECVDMAPFHPWYRGEAAPLDREERRAAIAARDRELARARRAERERLRAATR
jgi:penicillin-insensitive murein endopeptidase